MIQTSDYNAAQHLAKEISINKKISWILHKNIMYPIYEIYSDFPSDDDYHSNIKIDIYENGVKVV